MEQVIYVTEGETGMRPSTTGNRSHTRMSHQPQHFRC